MLIFMHKVQEDAHFVKTEPHFKQKRVEGRRKAYQNTFFEVKPSKFVASP